MALSATSNKNVGAARTLMNADASAPFPDLEFAHRARGGGLQAGFILSAAFAVGGGLAIWLLIDRLSSVRLGMLIGLAGLGVVGMFAVPILGFTGRHNTVRL